MFGNQTFGYIEFHLLAIAKGWIKLSTYPELLDSMLEAYDHEYADLRSRPRYAEKCIVERWLGLNNVYHLFDIFEMVKDMEPDRNCYHGYPNNVDTPEAIENRRRKFYSEYDPNYDAGYYGNWLKAIVSKLGIVETVKLPGFHQWLIDNNFINAKHVAKVLATYNQL